MTRQLSWAPRPTTQKVAPGDRFGQRTVIAVLPTQPGDTHRRIRLACDCGRVDVMDASNAVGTTKCRDCAKRPGMAAGDRFGRYTVVSLVGWEEGKGSRAVVKCDCGRTVTVRRDGLLEGRLGQCGRCRLADQTTHGHTVNHERTREYTAWRNAWNRVTYDNLPHWPHYGGRGITMCDEWLGSFEAFIAHIGPHPGPGYSLDRIDNDGNYEPGNVRWATRSQQMSNRRRRNPIRSTPS